MALIKIYIIKRRIESVTLPWPYRETFEGVLFLKKKGSGKNVAHHGWATKKILQF